jgi:hypothetical protein
MESMKPIHKAGAFSAFLIAAFIPLQMAVFFIWPPPMAAIDWFRLFQMNKLVGLLDMDLLLIVDQILTIFIYLALYESLKKYSPSLIKIAAVLGFISIATYFSSGSAFEMLRFSNMYTSAMTDTQKSLAITGGELALANWQGTAFDVAYVISGIAFLLISIVMFQSNAFGKLISYLTLVIGVLMLIPPTAGSIGMALAVASVFPLWFWAILIGREFNKLR